MSDRLSRYFVRQFSVSVPIASRYDPKYLNAYINRGLAYLNMGDNDRAIADYTEAIRLDPTVPAYTNSCIAYHNKGDKDRRLAISQIFPATSL